MANRIRPDQPNLGSLASYQGADVDLDGTDLFEKLKLRSFEGRFKGGRTRISGSGETGSLVGMNDNLKMTFKEIAAFIRANSFLVFKS